MGVSMCMCVRGYVGVGMCICGCGCGCVHFHYIIFCRLGEVLKCAEDIEIDVPKIWDYST